jgi:hypothetical protein
METVLEWLEEGYRMGEKAWLVVEYRSLVRDSFGCEIERGEWEDCASGL